MSKLALAVVLVLLVASGAAADPRLLDWSTSFEPATGHAGTLVELGTSPEKATFTGGNATSIGVPGLYYTGGFSWMVENGGTGVISFEIPAAEVEFFARDQSASTNGVITAFAPGGGVLDSIHLTTGFSSPMGTFLDPLGFSGLGPIDRIELTNASGISAVDDFGFSAVPEPSTLLLTILGGLAFLAVRVVRRQAGR